jgi:hypothetical protein
MHGTKNNKHVEKFVVSPWPWTYASNILWLSVGSAFFSCCFVKYGWLQMRAFCVVQSACTSGLVRAMTEAVCRQPLTAEGRVRSPVSPSEICSGQSGIGSGFSSEYLIFPCQYHSTTATYSSLSPRCSYQKCKRATPDKQCSFAEKRGTFGKKYFHFLYVLL